MMMNEDLRQYLIEHNQLYVYIFEWIDFLDFCKPSQIAPNDPAYRIIHQAFLNAGWKGNGILTEIWIPPFVVGKILNEPIDYGYNLIPSWTKGLILWHIKQEEDGLSFIGSVKKLSIAEYGLM